MKTRTLVFICISLVVAAVILMSGSCDNGVVTSSMVGTWINSDYDGDEGKIVIAHVSNNDYTWASYVNHDDSEPDYTVNFTVTSEITDSEGNLIVQSLAYPSDPEVAYVYSMVHADNQTLESNISFVDYPTEIDPLGEDYLIMYRQ